MGWAILFIVVICVLVPGCRKFFGIVIAAILICVLIALLIAATVI